MTTPDAVLEIAYSQIGYQEADDGGEYRYCPAMGWDPWSQWCGIFQAWCIVQAGGTYGGNGTAPLLHYTPSAAQSYQDRGAWSLTPERGDHIFFDWGGAGLGSDSGLIDHIGIVADASTWNLGYVTTVEGNITNGGNPAVGEFVRYASVISGFGRPLWTDTPTPEPVIPDTIFQEDDMTIIRADSGWFAVMGGRLVPILGGGQFSLLSNQNVAQVKVSEAQLAAIKAAFE